MILMANLPAIEDALETGAIVVIEDRGIPIRQLPVALDRYSAS
jgi:hypothetical protein